MKTEYRQMCSSLKIKKKKTNDREVRKMEIRYTEEKKFSKEQVEELFLSVGWVSGQYPNRLYKALMNSSTVLTAWDGEKLVGLLRAIDDGELLAYLHYLLVSPEYQGHGIARNLLELMKDKYKDYLYIELMPEEKKNVSFYEKYGFKVVDGATPMQKSNFEGFKD